MTLSWEHLDYWKPLAGLMLFLLALSLIERAIHGLSGQRLKRFIANNTSPPLRGVIAGTITTAILQSSSLVGLLMLAFVGARVIRLKNALAVVFGANLGTTFTGWIVAMIGFKLDLHEFSLPLIAIGGLVSTLFTNDRAHHVGRVALGLGLLLMAIALMKSAVDDTSTLINPQSLVNFSSLEFLAFGIVFSAIIQSSSATMVIALSAVSSGLIGLEAAAAMAIGADLGTTSTVLLGAFRSSANKKRVAAGHLLFNAVTDAIAFVILTPLLAALSFLEDPVVILVAFHTTFNLIGLLLFLPFIGPIATFLDDRFVTTNLTRNVYLESTTRQIPEAAIQALQNEVSHLINRSIAQNKLALGLQQELEPIDVGNDFVKSYAITKELEGEIVEFVCDIDRTDVSPLQSERIDELLQASREAILASKDCKDVLHDLKSIADEDPEFYLQIQQIEESYYERIQAIHASPRSALDQLKSLAEALEHQHHNLHEQIFAHIKADRITEHNVSSVLNLNRSLFDSNKRMLSAVSNWIGEGQLLGSSPDVRQLVLPNIGLPN